MCKGYEYSVAPWTQGLDVNLLRICRKYGSVEERIYGFILGVCSAHGLRWRSCDDVLRRMKVLGCEKVEVVDDEGEDLDVWATVRGKARCLDVFRSGRRASI